MLRVTDLMYSAGQTLVLNGVSFDVDKGAIVGIIGLGGTGKTVLLDVLSGYRAPTIGQIVFNDRRIERMPAHRIARLGVARTFQAEHLLPEVSLLDHLCLAQSDTLASGWRSLLGVPSQIERRSQEVGRQVLQWLGLGNLEHRLIAQLTLFEQRQVQLACALVRRPLLLLLDAPTSGLSHPQVDQLGVLLRRVRDEGVTIVMTDRDGALAQDICSVVHLMAEGKFLLSGRPVAAEGQQAATGSFFNKLAG